MVCNKSNSSYGKAQSGLGLIELMIAIVIGMIVTAGVLQVFVSTLVGSRDLLEQARLETELTGIVHFMANDIRRAGYWGDEGKDADWGGGVDNPFIIEITNVPGIAISKEASEADDSCALYTYNLDGSVDASEASAAKIGYCESCAVPTTGPFSSGDFDYNDNMEMFGYRLLNNAVEMRIGPNPDGSDTAFDCDAGEWDELSDSDVISITKLEFSFGPSSPLSVTADDGTPLTIEFIEVIITLEGNLVSDSELQKKITTSVKIANARVSS